MNPVRKFVPLFVAALVMSVISWAGNAAAGGASPDDTARFLAGLAPSAGSPLEALAKEPAWQSHAKYFNSAYKSLEDRQLSKVKAWSKSHVTKAEPVLFYMFSGPDYLYADAFFPAAKTYILAGLEPVGDVPDVAAIPAKQIGQELRELQNSLNTVLSFSFFITKKMKTELNSGKLRGTLPVLYTFLARAGKTVRGATLVSLKPDGTLGDGAEKGLPQGVKITFKDGAASDEKTLYYFSTDISDDGLKKSGFLTFLGQQGKGDGFVKSASYLMHSDNFAEIRGFLLKSVSTLVQDDSGIPLRFFTPETDWEFEPFGAYLAPIGIFPNSYQPKMKELFKKAQKIDFGIGYRWKPGESNVLIARRK